VSDATIATWYKKPGEFIKKDENLVDLETDKVVLEVPAPADGVLEVMKKSQGDTVLAGEVIGVFKPGAASAAASKPASKPAAAEPADEALSPAVRRLVGEHDIDTAQVTGTGKGGKITKDDVMATLAQTPKKVAPAVSAVTVDAVGDRVEKRVPMTRMRTRIAERLLSVTTGTAMLTTFNEVNMKPIMDLRDQYKDQFLKVHNVKLGFMSFFTKACVEALKRFPAVNASIDGDDIVYHGYFDIGIAVSTERGLVVPVLRNAQHKTMAQIEADIRDYAGKARDNKLTMDDMTGGTFTITNGGTFGSLLSTPILNSPQSAILGMHAIKDRPIAEGGQVVIRPMMNLALSYDHRIIDGKDSVSFLVAVKELLEDPSRMLLGV
jgi:2-oxoglutarate dehydrogenase E2 component (dihydrolipoamide succinyltransferase)